MTFSSKASFAVAMRDHQLQWALNGGAPSAALEERKGKTSWVLKPEHRSRNLFRSDWWQHIAGAEHRWARALNSSQCFGLNLFGPLADDNGRARRVLSALFPIESYLNKTQSTFASSIPQKVPRNGWASAVSRHRSTCSSRCDALIAPSGLS
jgi:hypothetical protein